MKLRPSKIGYKLLDQLKKTTEQNTYTKAIMIAAKNYPLYIKEVAQLKEQVDKLEDELYNIDHQLARHHESVQYFTKRAKEYLK